MSIDKNKTQEEFVSLLRQNIKNSTEIKGENKMVNMSFADDTIVNINKSTSQREPLRTETINSKQPIRETINSYAPQQRPIQERPIQERPIQERPIQERPIQERPTVQQQAISSISYSDFEKLKEDIAYKIDAKMTDLDNLFQNKIESFDILNNKFETLIEKLTNASITYNEINTVVEKLNSNNKEYLIEVKEQLENSILKVLSTLQSEISKTDEFVEDFLKNKANKKKKQDEDEDDEDEDEKPLKKSSAKKKDDEDDEDEDEKPLKKSSAKKKDDEDDEDEDEKPLKKSSAKKKDDEDDEDDEDDDDIFTRKKEKETPNQNLGFMGKLFKKIGL